MSQVGGSIREIFSSGAGNGYAAPVLFVLGKNFLICDFGVFVKCWAFLGVQGRTVSLHEAFSSMHYSKRKCPSVFVWHRVTVSRHQPVARTRRNIQFITLRFTHDYPLCFVTKQSGFTSATYVQMGASGFPHHFSARPFTSSVRERSQSLPKRAQSERVQKVLSW